MANEKYLVGVYGSLKKNFGNHRLLEDSKMLGTVWSKEKFTMYGLGGYPCITRDGDTSVFFEIYEVDETTLKRLYRLEGYNGTRDDAANTFYDTMDIETEWGKAEVFYFKQNPRSTNIITSGNWEETWRRAARNG